MAGCVASFENLRVAAWLNMVEADEGYARFHGAHDANFCSYTYFESKLGPEDEAALLRYVAELSVADYKFDDENLRKAGRAKVEQVVKQKKNQQRALRASRSKENAQLQIGA